MAETEIKIINGRTVCDTTARNQVKNKVDKVEGKGLSTVDFTTEKDTKLNGIAEKANNYTHPAKHNADVITQDATHRFVTDTEKETWNSKAEGNHEHPQYVTPDQIQTHSHENKSVLDGINQGKIDEWDSKASTEYVNTELAKKVNAEGYVATDNNYTTAEKNKLNGIAESANNYTHPKNHPATMITEDGTHKFVTDEEKAKWNAKSDFDGNYGSLNNAPILSFNEAGELVVTIGDVSKTFVPKVVQA